MIKGILFDKDGTLIEFEKTWHAILEAVFEGLAQIGYGSDLQMFKKHAGYKPTGFERESAIQYLSTSEIVTAWAHLSSKDEKMAFQEILRVFEQVTSDKNIEIALLAGTAEALKYLSEKGYSLGIATADTMTSCLSSLQRVGILLYFDFIGADDGTINPKPHTDMGNLFCERVNLKPEEVLVVGDSVTDYEFAKSFGGHFVGIRSGYSRLESDVPDEILLCDNIVEVVHAYKL